MVDFHIHTTYTDGMLTPDQVISKAKKAGLRVLAFTDHNFMNGEFEELQERYRGQIQLVNGIELSTVYTASDGRKKEVHVVGLGFKNGPMRDLVAHNQPDREAYINAMCKKLRACGLDMPLYDGMRLAYPRHRRMSRLQVADYVYKHGWASSINDAFNKYVGDYGERRAYVDPLAFADYVPLQDGVKAIRDAGGIPVLAHLFKYRYSDRENMRLIQMFTEAAGRDAGIEVYYKRYSKEKQDRLKKIADEWKLLWSSGSDYHGRTREEQLMSAGHLEDCPISRHVLTRLEQRGDVKRQLL